MTGLYRPLNIGSLHLEGNLFLAPLAGYTDKVFRSICLENGACLAYTEMVSSEGLARDSEKTIRLMDRADNEKNLAVQLFMPDADTASRSVENALKVNPQLIDVNMGCPVPKVTKTGAGSALLRNPDEIYRIVKALVSQCGNIPVTVKIRTGWDNSSINYLTCAEKAFSAGAGAVCMHARTKAKLYMPVADWSTLRDLKEHFPEKVIIGSGDVFTASDMARLLSETGVDAVVAARGAIGNPFIFNQAKDILEGRSEREIPLQVRIDTVTRHLGGLCDYLGEEVACREMRKHVCAYIKGLPGSSRVKNLVTQAKSVSEYTQALKDLYN